ncbi:MAG: iron-containing alcohol dehydrogenase [Oscillospiraceae bacterium]|nr:iron-containing alcohol dehydrogenase [Oscillospiraceae bacterium]
MKHMYYSLYQGVFRVAVNFLDWTPPKIISGPGSVKKLPAVIKSKGLKKMMIVTDKGLMSLNLLDGLFEGLKAEGIDYVVYDKTQPNPSIDNIEKVRSLYLDNGCEGFIAFGGGSPMDCAKAAGARVVRPNKTVQKMRGQLKVIKKLPPFFAVPTTAGTGSETTLAAVVTDTKTHEKYALNDPRLRPGYAVLDPELTVGLPPHITSTTGMDALTHAVEAYIGHSNTKETSAKAEQATKMIFENLETAYNNGSDIHAREQMLLASHYAGIAFTRAYVGNVHAIAHNLGGFYGVPHGLANAIILPYVLDYYGDTAYERLARLSEFAGVAKDGQSDEEKAKAFIQEIRDMNARMNIPDKIDKIQESDIPTIAQRALKEANPLYPVPKIMDLEDCMGVIRRLMP